MRLNRFIALSGVCSRRKAEDLIKAGEIAINHEVVRELAVQVDPSRDIVEYRGKRLQEEQKIYIMVNKPKGYVSTVKDAHNEKTVFDLVGIKGKRLYPAGRLDKLSRGLLVITNDGEFAYMLTHPKFKVEKVYEVALDKHFEHIHKAALLEKGMFLEGRRARMNSLEVILNHTHLSRIRVMLHEGRKRQIRIMFYKLGYKVKDLVRTQIGPLSLGNLKEAHTRELGREIVEKIKTHYAWHS